MRKKFTSRVDAKTFNALRRLAEKDGRQLQSLINEALTDLLQKYRPATSRMQVMAAYQRSHARYSELYKKLAQ
jgi:hypothetical protein